MGSAVIKKDNQSTSLFTESGTVDTPLGETHPTPTQPLQNKEKKRRISKEA